MILEINKCGSCGIETNKGKYWGTGAWLCDKCHNEWSEKDKKMRGDEFSVSESVIKKVRKGKKYKKTKITTNIHENGFQTRLNIS